MNNLFKIGLPVLLILILISTIACAPKASTPPATPPAPLPPEVGVTSPRAPAYDKGEFSPGGLETGAATDRKIIKTGYLTLDVKDVVEAMDKVSLIAKELDGYVVSSNKYETDEHISGMISIRVPAERFDEAFARLRQIAIKVPSENTQSQDVTQEYIDLQAQLRNLEATENQLLELLQKAQNVEETLKVYSELSNIRGQIEQIKGRIQYLERTSDMALIEITLQETKALTQAGWNALNTFKSAIRGLTSFGRVLADIAIWLLIFCWIWIPLLVLWLTKWRKRKA